MVKIVLIALSVIASVALAFPAQNSEDSERIPVRIVRSTDPHNNPRPTKGGHGHGGLRSIGGGPGGYIQRDGPKHGDARDHHSHRHRDPSISRSMNTNSGK